MAVVSISKLSEAGNHHRLDAEFYQPEYTVDFSKGDWKPLRGFLDICQYGISQAMTEDPIGHPIFRMDDIKDCFLLDDEVKYIEISDRVFQQFKLQTNDILFNRVNAEEFVGRTGIFKLQGDYVFASYLIRLRVKSNAGLLADYLNIFLNTKYGKKQIQRVSRRAVNQANVNAEELQEFRIAILPLSIQTQISQLSTEAWKRVELSRFLYRNAENLLLEELGLRDFKPKYEISYIANLSKAFKAHRIDAEYFQPAYDEIVNHLSKNFVTEKLKDIVSLLKHGKQPYYIEGGEVPILIQKHLGSQYVNLDALNDQDTPRTDREFIEKYPEYKIQSGDVLFYSVGAYLGRTNVLLTQIDAVPASFITLIRTKKNICSPMFLAVFLNSKVGQLQSGQRKSASAQQYIYPKDIGDFIIPILPDKTQQEIASLVQRSYEAKKKAKELLEEAKKKVENLIEGKD
jgi:restriction endonuclease S subunit